MYTAEMNRAGPKDVMFNSALNVGRYRLVLAICVRTIRLHVKQDSQHKR